MDCLPKVRGSEGPKGSEQTILVPTDSEQEALAQHLTAWRDRAVQRSGGIW